MFSILKNLLPINLTCIIIIILIMTLGGTTKYFYNRVLYLNSSNNYLKTELKNKKIEYDKKIEKITNDYIDCQNTIKLINDVMIKQSELVEKNKLRKKRIKNVYKKKKYIPFNTIFPNN